MDIAIEIYYKINYTRTLSLLMHDLDVLMHGVSDLSLSQKKKDNDVKFINSVK